MVRKKAKAKVVKRVAKKTASRKSLKAVQGATLNAILNTSTFKGITDALATARAKKVVNIVKTGLFVAVVALAALSLLTTLPIRTPIKPFIVLSGSMRSSIYEGSVSFVNREYGEVKVGDVITFIRPDDFSQNVTHRVTAAEEIDGKVAYKTKGDANNTEDAWVVRPEAIWGKVAFSLPLIGHIVNFSKTQVGVILVIVIPLILISIDELRIIRREIIKVRGKRKTASVKSRKSVALALLIYLIPIIGSNINATLAAFTDQTNVTNNSTNTGFWVPPTVVVTSPVSGDVWYHLNTYNITWTATPGCSTCTIADITISYSVDGGGFNQIATGEANDGTFAWTAPDGIFSSNVVIQVTATDINSLVGSDTSDVFTIKSPIVINEFLVNPAGPENAVKPGGQWVELKNLGSVPIDAAGWVLYDSNDNHELIVAANADNNGNFADAGETVVPAGSYLVVYKDGDPDFILDLGGGDSVRLYNAEITSGGGLVDSFPYTANPVVPENESYSRIPDGTGAFELTNVLTPLAENQPSSAPLILGAEPNAIDINESATSSPSVEPTSTPVELLDVLASPDPIVEESTASSSATPTPEVLPSIEPSAASLPIPDLSLTPTPPVEPTPEPAPAPVPNAVDIVPITLENPTNV